MKMVLKEIPLVHLRVIIAIILYAFTIQQKNEMQIHWWIFLFDSFGLKGLKNVIIKDGKKKYIKFCSSLADNKLILVETKFSGTEYKKIAKMELENLSTTARPLSHFTNTFGKLHDVRYEIRMYFLGDQIQKTETETCGIFQLYFFRNCLHHLLKF